MTQLVNGILALRQGDGYLGLNRFYGMRRRERERERKKKKERRVSGPGGAATPEA